MRASWIHELWWVAGCVLVLLFIGAIADHATLFLLLGALAYGGWHRMNVARLQRWLENSEKEQPPVSKGAWGEAFEGIHRLQVRNRKRKLKLAHLLNRFQEAAAALPDGVVMLNIHAEIEWFNVAAQSLLGLRRPQDVGQRIANLVRHPSFIEFLTGEDYSKPVELSSPAGSGTVLAVFIVPYGQEQRLLIARDITRIQRLEQVRRDFVANVSHELRTPLTVVHGYLETLSAAADECPREWVRALEITKQQTLRMQNIVDDLLLLCRLEADRELHAEERVAVPEMLAAIVSEAAALSAERAHRITLEADPELGLCGRYDELRSAFSNLVFNAVRHTPAGSAVHVRWFADEEGAHLEVRDTGKGIPSYHLPRLTERFYRVDAGRSRQRGGTGLGLAIVKHVLNHHGARLRIESEINKGSTFTCDFSASVITRLSLREAR